MNENIDCVIVAAGSGTRLGYNVPKAFVALKEKPLLYYSIFTFASHPAVSSVIVVVSSQMLEATNLFLEEYPEISRKIVITTGGDQRWQSVRNGIEQSDAEWVMVHDAARPFVSAQVIDSLLEKRYDYNCVITATPEVDTIRSFNGETTGETVDRSRLLRVGTPQLFLRSLLLKSFSDSSLLCPAPTDEAALFEKQGIPVAFSWGDPLNFKITTQSDLLIAEALLEKNSAMLMGR